MTPEEQGALDYLASVRKRRQFQRSLQASLKAPAGPAAQTKKNWAPLTKTGEIKGQAQ
jgi:hypothetical protein